MPTCTFFLVTKFMKRFILFLLVISSVSLSFAQLSSDGFYRVKNYGSGYYMWVCDNTGSIDYSRTNADMGSLQLWDGVDLSISEVSSVLYFTKVSGTTDKWNVQAQGTGVYEMIKHYVQIHNLGKANGVDLYQVFASESGMTLYLSDSGSWGGDYHSVGTTGTGKYTRWIAEPIDATTNNYFGIKPTLTCGGKYYAPFYADFAFTFASPGMKAYIISEIDGNIAVLKPIETEIIPRSTPVIIECSSADKSQNRLNLFNVSAAAVAGNKLSGVYFCNEFRQNSKDARTAFNAARMRVLHVNTEGQLVFDTSTADLHVNWFGDDGYRYLNSNQSYLPVPAGAPSELVVMTEAEYANYLANKTYTITFKVDGVVYKTAELKAGEPITAEQVPTKEGYTFSGWGELPETMPTHDVTVNGSYQVNTYVITYMVDGAQYGTGEVKFGAEVNPIGEPTKEGYTFSGWKDVPATMPAKDVVVTGTFSINNYKVTFIYGDNLLKTITVEYGATIPLPTSLESDRYTLLEWLEVPATMPARDLTIYANFVDRISGIAADRQQNTYIMLNGTYTNTLTKGVYVIRMDDGTVKKIMVR